MADDPCDILRLTNCPRCAYSFEGLPRRGRCPECGLSYNQDMRLFPIHPHSWWLTRTARLWPVVLIVMGVVRFVLELFLELSLGSRYLMPILFMGMGITIIFANWQIRPLLISRRIQRLQKFEEQHPAIFFNSRGVALRKRGLLLTLWPWECFDKFSFEEFESGLWRLRLRPALLRPTVAPTIDADLLLGDDAEVSAFLRKEIQRWLEDSRTNASSA